MHLPRPTRGRNNKCLANERTEARNMSPTLNAAQLSPCLPVSITLASLCTIKVSSFQDGKRRDKWRMDDSVCKSSNILNLECIQKIVFLLFFPQSSAFAWITEPMTDQELLFKTTKRTNIIVNGIVSIKKVVMNFELKILLHFTFLLRLKARHISTLRPEAFTVDNLWLARACNLSPSALLSNN